MLLQNDKISAHRTFFSKVCTFVFLRSYKKEAVSKAQFQNFNVKLPSNHSYLKILL